MQNQWNANKESRHLDNFIPWIYLLQPLLEYSIVSQHRQSTMDNAEACVKTASRYIRPPRPSNILSAPIYQQIYIIWLWTLKTDIGLWPWICNNYDNHNIDKTVVSWLPFRIFYNFNTLNILMLGIVLPTLMCFNLNTCCVLELHLTEFVIFLKM